MILKYQQGGGTAAPPFVAYQPLITSGGRSGNIEGASSSSKKSSKEENDVTDLEILKLLDKIKALPSDRQFIQKKINALFFNRQYGLATNAQIANELQQILYYSQLSAHNEEMFKAVREHSEKNGGLNEIAVSSDGKVYAYKDDDYQKMTIEEAEASGYTPLTNAQLLNYRSSFAAFGNEIFEAVDSSISMKNIIDYINSVIQGLGKDTMQKEGFFRTSSTQVIRGLQEFQKALDSPKASGNYDATIDNLYKYNVMNVSQANQAMNAIESIYITMPANAKALLKYKSLSKDDKGALNLLEQIVGAHLSTENKFTLSVDTPNVKTNADGTKTTTGGTLEDKTFKLGPVELLDNGYGQKQEHLIQTGQGNMNGIKVTTVQMPITKGGNQIGIGTLEDVATSDFGGYLDLENVTIGGVRVDPTAFQNVAVNGTQLHTAWLPVDQQELLNTGNIRPDIDSLRRLKVAQDIIKNKGIKDPQQINEVLKAQQLPMMFDGKDVILTNYSKFGIINGTAIQQALPENAQVADYLTETTDQQAILNTLSILQKGRGEKDRIKFNEKNLWNGLWNTYDHVYKGTIFIPVHSDYFTNNSGQQLTPGQAAMIDAKQQAEDREKDAVKKFTLAEAWQ